MIALPHFDRDGSKGSVIPSIAFKSLPLYCLAAKNQQCPSKTWSLTLRTCWRSLIAHLVTFFCILNPGHPFRLQLWHRLATFLGDPDADFLLQLPHGVPLGVNEPLKPSPAWPAYTGTLPEEVPLQDCLDSWKSAQDHPEIVQSLIQEELDAGFIAHVPGGVTQLKQMRCGSCTRSRTTTGR